MPGVISYSNDLTFDDINNTVIDHKELESKAGELVHKMHNGAPNSSYFAISKKSRKQSSELIAKHLHDIILNSEDVLFG